MRVRLDLVLERQFGSLLSERCRIRFAASRQVRRACVDQQDKKSGEGRSRQTWARCIPTSGRRVCLWWWAASSMPASRSRWLMRQAEWVIRTVCRPTNA